MHVVHAEYPEECLVDGLLVLEASLDLVDEADGLHEVDGLLVPVEVLQLDGESLGQEGVESGDELRVAIEEGLDTDDDARGVDPVTHTEESIKTYLHRQERTSLYY